MSELPDNSVQCCVTSPPYWGLRKYAGNQDLIWGDNHHEHVWEKENIHGELRTGIIKTVSWWWCEGWTDRPNKRLT
jgi:DNA modification methylase